MTKDANGNDFRPGSEEEDYPTSVIHAPGTSQPFVRAGIDCSLG